MNELIKSLSETSVPTILVIAGVLFLFISIGGQLGAHVATTSVKRKFSGTLGVTLLMVGISIHFVGRSHQEESTVSVPNASVRQNVYLLRPRSIEQGLTVEGSFQMNMPDATLKLLGNEGSIIGKMTLATEGLTRTEIISSLHGRPTKLKQTILRDLTKTTTRMGEHVETEHENGVLQGHTILIEKQDGVWTKNLIGTKATEAQQIKLQEPYADEYEMYPAAAIEIGTSWTVAGPQLVYMLGVGNLLSADGSAHFTFEKLEKCGDDDCALISIKRLEIKTKMLDNDGDIMQVNLGGQGVIFRSLSDFVDTKVSLNGTMSVEGTKLINGASIQITVVGPLEMSGVERLLD
uniref:Uncharacterized protein n=1 Tax=Candidatus Kentrum sp. FW TaxID=2126338 RepID=A0A450TQV8_9GAMM|nr:MAG: hypothetical protein BECKFW1821C_GA0114237_102322 [Candidatus Kentron sp. FW]